MSLKGRCHVWFYQTYHQLSGPTANPLTFKLMSLKVDGSSNIKANLIFVTAKLIFLRLSKHVMFQAVKAKFDGIPFFLFHR